MHSKHGNPLKSQKNRDIRVHTQFTFWMHSTDYEYTDKARSSVTYSVGRAAWPRNALSAVSSNARALRVTRR